MGIWRPAVTVRQRMADQPRKSFDPGSMSTVKSLAKFPDEAPYPILRVGLDGTLIYANRPSTALLAHWDVQVGDPVGAELVASPV